MRSPLILATTLALITSFVPAEAEPLNSEQKMVLVKTIGGKISPKSVLASGSGLVSAHSMMYSHNVTIYDANKS
jgi:predicted permease